MVKIVLLWFSYILKMFVKIVIKIMFQKSGLIISTLGMSGKIMLKKFEWIIFTFRMSTETMLNSFLKWIGPTFRAFKIMLTTPKWMNFRY